VAESEAEVETVIENKVDYDLVVALENENKVLREKCLILESQFKLNRRISPRKELKVGKTIDPPPMAPPETYVSSQDEIEISEGQLKVLRTELRQREEFVSRLISDGEIKKNQLKIEKNKNLTLKQEYEKLAAGVAAKDALLKDYEQNDQLMKKMVFKYQNQLEGTYDGDEDLKNIIKDKIAEIENINSKIKEKQVYIKKLKRKMKKKLRKNSINEQDIEEIDTQEDKNGSEVVQEAATKTDAEVNPDDYVNCSVQ